MLKQVQHDEYQTENNHETRLILSLYNILF